MANNFFERMTAVAAAGFETPKTPLSEWFDTLSDEQKRLLETARARGEKSGPGYELLVKEQRLRIQTIQEKDRNRH